jgi:PAS domain S-box-containing protein
MVNKTARAVSETAAKLPSSDCDAPVPLESILCTEELIHRPSHPAEYQKENEALIALLQGMVNSPQDILQTLADIIREMLGCGSAGISLLASDGGASFYWPAISGIWKPHIGGGTPRDFGPCGDVLDRNQALLFKHVERRYTYFRPVQPLVEEALLVPFYVGGAAVGTVWAVIHDEGRRFDMEDKRQLETLAKFASAAYQTVLSRDASQQLAAIVSSSDDAIVSKNLDGVIRSWNAGAERLFGYTAEEAIGKPITLIIPADYLDEEPAILERIRKGERVDHFETVRRRKDGRLINISLTISPVKDDLDRVIGASKIARDITDRKDAEEARKSAEIASKLLQVQDAERRRIARELHDGVGQIVAAIAMNVSRVSREKDQLSDEAARCVVENMSMIEQVNSDIRTVSYLLHPPMLDEIGLASALSWFVEGFSQRSKISVTLEIEPDFGRLPQGHELALFRVVQECLTNIHRHSGSSTATVRLCRTEAEVKLDVSDSGGGIGQETSKKIASGVSAGVGVRGMQERIKQMRGRMTINSSTKGTSVLVTLPISVDADAGRRAPVINAS